MDTLSLLARNPIFSQLGKPALAKVAAHAQRCSFQRGEWIVHHGDVWPNLFLLPEGEVKAIKESLEGRSLTLAVIHSTEIFWGLAFFLENAPMPAGLMASQDCELFLWSRKALLPFVLNNGRFSWELSCLVIRRVQIASEIVEMLAFQPVAGRLAGLLLEQCDNARSEEMPRDLTLDEMAARIGSTREVVSRLLHRFSDEEIIHITRTEFSVADHQKLKDLAQKVKG
jgi:CRP/FNR family cyclic AMP-dependent transcriptional regulator